jgi:predicted nucleic acid-binding protein
MEQGETELLRKYEEALAATALLVPFDVRAAKNYAVLRCDRTLRAPDTMQLACAAAAGVDLFITNDTRLHNRHVAGIQFIASLEQAPL